MTFISHLGELRMRLIRSAIAAAAGFLLCYAFSNTLIEWLSYPLRGLQQIDPATIPGADGEADPSLQRLGEITWVVLNPLEPFLVKIKIAAYAGLSLAFPVILYQIRAFVFPGLKTREKRLASMLIGGCVSLGIVGASAAYWAIFPLVLPFLVAYTPLFVKVQLRLNDTLSLILKGMFAFAAAFQLPMIVMALVYVGLLTPAALKAYRKVAIIGIFVASALLTPPDPISLLMMASPLVLLYEFSIWLSYFVVRRKVSAAESKGD